MSKISNWINDNYDILKEKIKTFNVKDSEDIFQEVLIYFMDMDTGKTMGLINSGDADKYVMAMFKINAFSETSPYQRKYNQYKMVELYDEEVKNLYDKSFDVSIELFNDLLEDVDEFFIHKIIYRQYVYNKIKTPSYSINKMSIESTIPQSTLEQKFNKIRTELKNKRNDL